MSLRTKFTDSEWQTLEKTPVWAFVMTAASDGKVDKKELKAFAKELSETMLYKDELAREVFMSLVSRLNEILPTCIEKPDKVIAGLESAGRIVDSKCPENSNGFKGAVLTVCKNVAEASGGGIFKREKVSTNEATAIVVVAAALGMKLS